MSKDNLSSLYNALISKGYSADDLGDENTFRTKMSEKGNRKELYDYVSGRGDFRIGDYDSYESRLSGSVEGSVSNQVVAESGNNYNPEAGKGSDPTLNNTGRISPPSSPYVTGKGADVRVFDVPYNDYIAMSPQQQSEVYQKAIDKKKVEESELISQSLSSQKESVNADLRNVYNEIRADEEQYRKEHPLLSFLQGFGQAQTGGRNQRTVEADPRYRNLQAASNLIDESENLLNEAKANKDSAIRNFGRGFRDMVFDVDTWTAGFSDLNNSLSLSTVLDKAEKGEELSPDEQRLLDASVINLAVNAFTSSDISTGYNVGKTSAYSIPFMLEFAVNPISRSGNTIARNLLEYGLKRFGRSSAQTAKKGALNTLGRGITSDAGKFAGRFVGDTAAAAGMTATTSLPRVMSGAVERMNDNYTYDVDENGELAVKRDGNVGIGEAVGKSAASTLLENQSEMVFNAFKGMGKSLFGGINKSLPGGVQEFFNRISSSKPGQLYRELKNNPTMREIAQRTQFHGLPEEYLEEVYNNFANIPLGEMSWEEATDLDNNIQTFLSLAPTSVMFGMLGLGSMASERYSNRRKLNRAFGRMNEEQKAGLKELLRKSKENGNAEIREFIKATIADESMTPEQKREQIEHAFEIAKGNAIDDIQEAETEDSIEKETEEISSLSDPSTGTYTEANRIVVNDVGEEVFVPGYIVGNIGGRPVWVAEGMENVPENRITLKPGELDESSVRSMPTQEVMSSVADMRRAQAKEQAENESKYSPDIKPPFINEMFSDGTNTYQIVRQEPDGSWLANVLNESGTPIRTIPMTDDEYYRIRQSQIDAEEQRTEGAVSGNKLLSDGRMAVQTGTDGNEVAYDVTDRNGNVVDSGSMQAAEFSSLQDYIPESNNMSEKGADNETRPEDGESKVSENPTEEAYAIPSDEKGNLLYHKVPVNVTVEALNKEELEPEEVDSFVKANKDASAKLLSGLQNKPPKMGTNIAKYKADKQAWQEKVADAQSQVDYWNLIDESIAASRVQPGDKTAEEIREMGEPLDGHELAARSLANGRLPLLYDDYKRELGFSDKEASKMFGLFKNRDNGGLTIEQAGELLMQNDLEEGTNFFDQNDANAGRNAILDVLSSARTRNDLSGYIKKNREAMAERERTAEREYEDKHREDWAQENFGMSYSDYVTFNKVIDDIIREKAIPEEEIGEFYNTFAEELNNWNNGRVKEETEGNDRGPDSEGGESGEGVLPDEQLGDTGGVEADTPAETDVNADNEGVPAPEENIEARIEEARKEVAPNPTDAQKEAGNYKKGHIKIDGYDITIENPKGSERSGTDANGDKWSVTMNNDYGYIRGTEGMDGDHIDVFLSDNPAEGNVYVVDQLDVNTGKFDEHKVMYGFGSIQEATDAYLANYSPGWMGIGAVTEVSKDEFKKWIDSSHRKTKPFVEYKSVNAGTLNVRFREVESDKIASFATKHNISESDVRKYAQSMKVKNLGGASYAFKSISRSIRLLNSDLSLGQFVKVFSPIKKELYENFGDIDALREEYIQREMENRNVMEAARKRAEEEAEAERKRLEEFELMSDEEMDAAYFKALEANDESRMRDIVNEAARRKGYVSADEFRMAHRAPSYDEEGIDKSMVDVAANKDQIRESLNEQFRMNRDKYKDESATAINSALDAIDKGDKPTVTIYRAVPKSLKEGKVRNGDWVSLSESYVKVHGEHALNGNYRIMKEEVPAENLYWDGNDINEWGYDDRSDYRYKDTKNNRKLNDLITRDNKGDVIPPSKRFNARKADPRFRFIGEQGAENLDRSEEATTRLDNLSVARDMEKEFNAKKERIAKLRESKPVEITGKEYEGKYELNRDSAQKYILDNLRGEYTINDTGERVKVSKKGAKKVTSHSQGDEAHMKSIAAIPELIENAVFIEERHPYKENAQYDSFRYYVAGLKIGGEDYTVRITIGVKKGEFYYDHYLTEIEKGNLIEVAQSFRPTEDAPNPSYAENKDSILISILQTNDKENARKIKMATGWERGADGKWRYEMGDSKLKDTISIEGRDFKRNVEDMLWTSGKLIDTVDDDNLFKAYPELSNVRLETDTMVEDMPSNGSYNAKMKTITIHASELKYLNKILNHEIQHAIQDIEGFSGGGSPELFMDKGRIKELEELRDDMERRIEEGEEGLDESLQEVEMELFDLKEDTPYYKYKSLSGEVESRNVESRMDMTPEQRRATLAEETEDVAREDQIFLEKALPYISASAPIADATYKEELSDATKIVENFENLTVIQGKITQAIEDLSSALHTPVKIARTLDDVSDTAAKRAIEQGRSVKAWFDPNTGEVVVYLPNATDVNDAVKSVLHEVVGHKGLREMLVSKEVKGAEERKMAFDNAMMELYRQLPIEVRDEIADIAVRSYGGDVSIAMDEYLAEQAEKNEIPSWWNKVVATISDLLRKFGIDVKLSENDVRYLLWESQRKLRNSGNPIDVARETVMRDKLGIGEHSKRAYHGGDSDFTNPSLSRFSSPARKEGESVLEYADRVDKAYREFLENQEALRLREVDKEEKAENKDEIRYGMNDADKTIAALNSRISSLEKKISKLEDREELRRSVTEFIRKEVGSELMGYLDKQDLNSLLIQAQNAKSAKSLEKIVMNVKNVMLNAQRRRLQRIMDRLLSLKVQDVNGKNMSIAKNVDDSTRKIFSFLRGKVSNLALSGFEDEMKYIRREIKDKRVESARLNNILGTAKEEEEKRRLSEQLSSLSAEIEELKGKLDALKEEAESVKEQVLNQGDIDVDAEMKRLDEKLENAAAGKDVWTLGDTERMAALNILSAIQTNKKHDYEIDAIEIDKQKLILNNSDLFRKRIGKNDTERKRITEQINENYRRIVAYDRLVNDIRAMQVKQMGITIEQLNELIGNGKNSLMRKTEEEIKRKRELVGKAIRSVEGKPIDFMYTPKNPKEAKKSKKADKEFWAKKFFSAPLGSFEYMCRKVNTKTLGKDGFLYKRFIEGSEGTLKAYDTYVEGMKEFRNRLDEKCKEVFGKKFEKIASLSDKPIEKSGVYIVQSGNGQAEGYGVRYELPLTKGQAMYIYQVWKMNDGRTKLELQGFDEESIKQIVDFLGDEYVRFADWVQDEFLKDMREKYNSKYLEMYNTSLAEIENYIPLKIRKQAIRIDKDLSDTGSKKRKTLEEKAGSLINRTVNTKPVDITYSGFDVLLEHGNQMEEWNAYSRVRKDLDYILSSKTFENQLNANTRGSYENFYDAAEVATKSNHPDSAKYGDMVLGKLSKGIVGGNIAFRLNTALKQVLSAPAFFGYSQSPAYMGHLVKSMATPYASFKWCMENIPSFYERVNSGTVGNEKLDEKGFSKLMDKYIEVGMIPNKLVDAITCSIGAKSIYDYKFGQLNKSGISEEEARQQALREADIYYNATQQSSHPAFLSPMQMSNTLIDRMLTTYQNSNIGYVRRVMGAFYDLTRSLKWKEMKADYVKMYMEEGMPEQEAESKAYRRMLNENRKNVVELALFGWGLNLLWSIGSQGLLGFFRGDGDDDEYKWTKDLLFILTSPMKGMPGVNLIESVTNGYRTSPVLVYEELDKFMKELDKTIDEYGIVSPEMAYITLAKASRYSGVDLEVWGNIYLGIEGITWAGLSDDKMIDIMYMLNSPKSSRETVAKELYKNEPLLEYAEKIARAMKYIPKEKESEIWVPGVKPLTKRKEREIKTEAEILQMTPEERKKYEKVELLKKHVRKMKSLKDDPKELKKYIEKHKDELNIEGFELNIEDLRK